MSFIILDDFDAKEFEEYLIEGLEDFGSIMIEELGQKIEEYFIQWMSTWDRKYPITINRKPGPRFEVETQIENTGATGSSAYDDRPARDNVPAYLNFGTSIRFGIMTDGFNSKTTPGQIQSGLGAGGFSHVDINDPQQGIQARLVDEKITKILDETYFDKAADMLWPKAFP